ncbi:HNH endonuclease [Macrococcus animalis]|uniref:HNH endonuclease n=1 Tax=Macrococcus animalis TaxID=3395467 RepID=UPI0039BE6CF9
MKVKEVIPFLYKYNTENKRIINSDDFINKIVCSESELQDLIESDTFIKDNYPKEVKSFTVSYKKTNVLDDIKEIDQKFMENLYIDRLRSQNWGHFKPIFFKKLTSKCIYCGIKDATTLDHIFPKSRYITLSIVPINLFPCCYECNKNKGEFISNNIVFYPIDRVGLYENLSLESITIDDKEVLNIRFNNVSNNYNDYITTLKLEERLNDIVNNELGEYIVGVFERYKDLELIIEEFSKHKALTLGRNYMEEAMEYLLREEELLESYTDIIRKDISS